MKLLKKITTFLLVITFTVCTIGSSVLAAENSISTTVKNKTNEETNQSGWDGKTTESTYEGQNFKVTFSLTGCWDGGYNASVKINNTGDSAIENWYLGFQLNNNITNIWNAEIFKSENAQYVIKNADWNQDIESGTTVEFGFSVNENFCGFPAEYKLLSSNTIINDEKYSVEYHLDSEWDSGFTGSVTIQNNADDTVEDWTLEFDYERTITQIWNAEIESHEGNHYVIKNADYNSNIEKNQSISFGFNGSGGTIENVPGSYKLNSYTYAAVDYNDDDGDGLPNFYEDLISSDKSNTDSDGDGLSDGYEIFTLQTNPTLVDSDQDGIADGDEDEDSDGLCNLKEYNLGINPKDIDTDGDGLSDKSELIYCMNPNDQDTLDDGVLDGNRTFKVKYDGETADNESVTPHLDIELKGNQVDSLNINKIDNNDPFLNDSIPGYIANGYDLNVDGTFEDGVLSFELSDELLKDDELEPTIYYFNKETQLLEEVENQYVEDNRICTKLQHFSSYILLSKNKYNQQSFCFTIAAPTDEDYMKQTFDVAFLLDESGSISNSNFSLMKSDCKNLADKLSDSDRVAVYTFDDSVRKQISFSSKTIANSIFSSLYQHDGCTAIYDTINESVNEYNSASIDSASRIVILVTDGYDNWSSISAAAVSQKAKDNNIIIYAIGVGSVNTSALTTITSLTGGAYYNISSFSMLENIFNRVISEADLYKDSDNDGLSDYHEKKIAAGQLMIGSGETMNNFTSLSYLNPDSDGDGIVDGDEIEIRKLSSGDNYYCYLHSNPCMIDTDADSYPDYVEEYIGTSPISKSNTLAVEEGSFNRNTWPEWKEMFESHSWNYIHNLVELNVVQRYYPTITKEFVIDGVGRADLFRRLSYEIWDVKPASYSTEPNLSKGLSQIMRYADSNPLYKVGGLYITANTFQSPDGEYTINYNNMNNGLIIYNFKKNEKQKEPVPVKEKEKEPGYVYKPQTSANDYAFWGTLAGVTIIGGTLVEDVLTGGAGIADDAPSFTFALGLIIG